MFPNSGYILFEGLEILKNMRKNKELKKQFLKKPTKKRKKEKKAKAPGRRTRGNRYSSHPRAQQACQADGERPTCSALAYPGSPVGQGQPCKVHSYQGKLPHSEHHWSDGHERKAQHPEAKYNLWLFASPSLPCRDTKRQSHNRGLNQRGQNGG